MNGNNFEVRYAVRMPDGELWSPVPPYRPKPPTDYSMPSIARDFFGMTQQEEPEKPPVRYPGIFGKYEDAEDLRQQLADKAEALGVLNWGGCVVWQLCSPFTSGHYTEEFMPRLLEWMRTQGTQQP